MFAGGIKGKVIIPYSLIRGLPFYHIGDKKKQRTVTSKIEQIKNFFKILVDNPKSEELLKYVDLVRKWCKLEDWKDIPKDDDKLPTRFKWMYDNYKESIYGFESQLYNIWKQQSIDSDNTHFGKFPQTFMENLLYYYTKPFDVVYDPFAGGGVTIDACKKWLRKYYVSDRKPIETRKDIIKWDIIEGLPKDLSSPDFVFLDPPYWKQAEGKYSKDKQDLGNMDLTLFYETLNIFIKELKKKIKGNGYVAFVIQPTQWNNDKKFEDHIIKITKMFNENGFEEEMRYCLPYSTEQYNAQMVEVAKKEKICLNIIRDLIVFKRKITLR